MMLPHPEVIWLLHNAHGNDLANQFRATRRRPTKARESGLRQSHRLETLILRLRMKRRAETL